MRVLAILLPLLVAMGVNASTITMDIHNIAVDAIQDQAEIQGLPWTVGDETNYKINMGFLQGTMKMRVREETDQGFWVNQDVNLMIQQSRIEVLFDKNDGSIIRMIVDGREQEPQEQDIEIIETREDTVTVPAGTFDAIYIKARDNNQNQEIQQWINLRDIAISGMAKAITPGQFGEVVIELQNTQRAN